LSRSCDDGARGKVWVHAVVQCDQPITLSDRAVDLTGLKQEFRRGICCSEMSGMARKVECRVMWCTARRLQSLVVAILLSVLPDRVWYLEPEELLASSWSGSSVPGYSVDDQPHGFRVTWNGTPGSIRTSRFPGLQPSRISRTANTCLFLCYSKDYFIMQPPPRQIVIVHDGPCE
jgi:hypothetical protein